MGTKNKSEACIGNWFTFDEDYILVMASAYSETYPWALEDARKAVVGTWLAGKPVGAA